MWNLVECTQQGRSHVKQGIPCQDKTFCQSYGDVYTIALADGAGSACYSHYGAESVTKCISEELGNNFESYWEEADASTAKNRLYQEIYDALQQLASEKDCELKELASTLLAVAVKEDRYIIFHVGDGVIGYYKNGEIKVASTPNNGEFANTTIFTTSSVASSQTKMIKGYLGDIKGFVLMSDGPEACLYNHQQKKLAAGLIEIFDDAATNDVRVVTEGIREAMSDVIIKHTTDDCSLALMVKKAESIEYTESTESEETEDISEHNIVENEVVNNDFDTSSQKHYYLLGLSLLLLVLLLVYAFV